MSRVKEMISALRKCAKEHENDVVCTGQIITSSLCKDVADYLEADRWHYPSKGELPNCTQEVLIVYGMEQHKKLVMWRQDFGRFGSLLPIEITAWQYIVPPKEEA